MSAPIPQTLASDQNPALLYLTRLAPGSRRTQQAALDRMAALLSGGKATAVDMPWHLVTSEQTEVLRADLAARYAPPTTNRMLAALRGVLRRAWRLGLMDAEAYHQASAVKNVPWFTPPRGRTLTSAEIQALFAVCAADPTPAGARDAAVLAVLYAGGLRRAEAVALEVADYDPVSGALTVRSTESSRERTVYATNGAAEALRRWLTLRGTDPGPFFVPINKAQKILVRDQRMNEHSIYKVLQKRGEQAGVTAFSCQDLRRSFIAQLLEAGADITTVQRLAGHGSVLTTQRYDHRSQAAHRQVGRMLPIPGSDQS